MHSEGASPGARCPPRPVAGIPGIAERTAKPLPAEIPENRIGGGRLLSADAGVVPPIAPSATSLNRSGLCRAGHPALRRRLTLAAVVAGTWCPELKAFKGKRVAKGKSPKAARCAVAHPLLRIIAIVLTTGLPLDPQKRRPTA